MRSAGGGSRGYEGSVKKKKELSHPILKRPQALRDIEEIFVFLGTEDLDVGFQYLDAIEQSFSHISSFPRSSPIKKFGIGVIQRFRMFPVKGFRNFLIFYRESNDSVEVVRVLHGARDIPRFLA